MKILGLATSPRKGGNTELLLDAVLKGAASQTNTGQKIQLEKLSVNDLKIAPCRECNGCFKTGRCVVKDDFQLIYDKFIECDRLIFASPIYFMTMSAQAKTIVDRCQCFWARKYILKKSLRPNISSSIRRGVLVSVGGTRGKHLFDCLKLSMKYFFDVLEMEYIDSLTFRQIDEKGAILQHPIAMQEAYQLGISLVPH